jgi:hypothetical protein
VSLTSIWGARGSSSVWVRWAWHARRANARGRARRACLLCGLSFADLTLWFGSVASHTIKVMLLFILAPFFLVGGVRVFPPLVLRPLGKDKWLISSLCLVLNRKLWRWAVWRQSASGHRWAFPLCGLKVCSWKQLDTWGPSEHVYEQYEAGLRPRTTLECFGSVLFAQGLI